MDDTTRRLGRLEDNQLQIVQTLAEIKEHLADMNGDLTAVRAEVGAIPEAHARAGRDTLTARIHRIENNNAAASAAEAALVSADASRAQSAENKRLAWSWKQKNALFALAAVTALVPLLRLFGIGG